MRLIKWMLCSFLLCGPLLASAQKGITLSWLPTSFIEMDGGFTAGAEYRLNDKLALLGDVGIIFYKPYNNNKNNGLRDGLFGYKFKPEIRRYFKSKSKHENSGGFVSFEGLYKHVTYQRFDGIPVLDNLGNTAYTYLGGYRIQKDVYGGAIKIGFRQFFGPEYKIGVEAYWGMGVKHKSFALRDLPPGADFNQEFFVRDRAFDFFWAEGRALNMPAGFKLLWRIR